MHLVVTTHHRRTQLLMGWDLFCSFFYKTCFKEKISTSCAKEGMTMLFSQFSNVTLFNKYCTDAHGMNGKNANYIYGTWLIQLWTMQHSTYYSRGGSCCSPSCRCRRTCRRTWWCRAQGAEANVKSMIIKTPVLLATNSCITDSCAI